MNTAHGILKTVLGIAAAGALFKLAGDGLFGESAKKLAKYITAGYGV